MGDTEVAERDADRRRQALRAFMERRGTNPNAWATLAGLPNANSLYNFLEGRSRSLNHATLAALAKAYGVRIAQITDDEDDTQEGRLLAVFRGLDTWEQRERAINILKEMVAAVANEPASKKAAGW